MSSNNSNKNESRDKEKEELLQRLRQIEKEEAEEEQHEVEQAFLIQPDFFIRTFDKNENNENVDINKKVKRKRNKNDNDNITNKFEDEEDESRITFNDKTFLDLKQENLAKEFLLKPANNDNLYIFPNNYEPADKRTFILLNLPEDKESFQEFINYNYTSAQSNLHGVLDFSNFKVYYTNTLQTVPQIVDEVTTVFINSGFTAVKMQLRFGVIWEGPTIESNNVELISQYTSIDFLS
jgi:hypothetical protein